MTSEFPAHLFKIGGSPETIQGSAAEYRTFGRSASEAADQMTAMDTTQFIGPEGDQFREKLTSNMPPHLRITGEAFTKVAQALSGFASQLADLQGQMRPVEGQAPGAWQRLQAAKSQLAQAQAADQRHEAAQQQAQQQHQQAVSQAQANNQPPPPAPTSNYQAQVPSAQAELSAAQREWDALVRKAGGLRGEMTAASESCTKAINTAKSMRFKEPPADYNLIAKGQNFIREHKDVLKKISGALKIVSAVVSAIGLALQAIPVVGNAVGGALLIAGGIMGGAALAIDAGIYAATGEGSLTSIMIDTALTIIPIGRVAKLGKKAFNLITPAAKSADDVAAASNDVAKTADDIAPATDDAAQATENTVSAVREFDEIPMRADNMGEHIPGNSKFGTPVQYLTSAERKEFMLSVGDDGLVRNAKGELFDTATGTSVHADDPRAIFVMDKQGNIYASNYQEVGRFHHSSLVAGNPVSAAGELKVEEGVVKFVSNASGHYRPGREATLNFMKHLFNDRGAKLDPDADVKILE